MDRKTIHDKFIKEFHYGEAIQPSWDEIHQIEIELKTVLPQSYIDFMTRHGEAYAPSLLSLIVDQDSELFDLQNITSTKDTIEGTKMYWSGGMPDDLIGFGNDSMGNMFCFKRIDQNSERPDDVPVWVFDHDFIKVSQISDSFDRWLETFILLKESANNGIE
jgi:hypothetical protein